MARERKNVPSRRLAVLLTVLAALLVAVAVAFGSITGRPWFGVLAAGGLLAAVAAAMAAYGAAILLAIAVHEAGHYLAGRAVGFQLRLFNAGPFGLRREGGRMVPYRVRPARLGGFVAMVPPDDRAHLRRFAVLILGGPLASVLWTATVFGVWLASGVPTMSEVPRGAPIGTVVGAYTAMMGLLGTVVVLPGTLLPYRIRRYGGLPTDALWLWLLLRGGEETRRLMALSTLTRLALSGTEAEELPTGLLKEATRLRDGSMQELSALALRGAATARRDPTTARAMLARHAEVQRAMGPDLAEPWRTWARIVQADDAAFRLKDAEATRAWLEGTMEPSDPALAASAALARAGLAALRDDPDRATLLDRAEAAVESAARRTTVGWRTERERLAALRAGWPREARPDAPPPNAPLDPPDALEDQHHAAAQRRHQRER